MNDTEKTGKIVKYLICLFAAAAVLLLAGGFKKTFRQDADAAEHAKIRTEASRYLSAGNGEMLFSLAERSPEFLLYAAAGANLSPADPVFVP